MSAPGLITVWLHVPPALEEEFNDWYALEHLQQVVSVPGILGGRRYVVDDAKPKYLAWYEARDAAVEPGPDFKTLVANPTGWTRRMVQRFEVRERMNFALARDVGDTSAVDTPWVYLVHTDIPDDVVDEYNAWYDNEHLPRLVTVPGVVRARRYVAVEGGPKYLTAYQLTDRDAFESPAGLQARKTPWTARMRSLFQNTRRNMCRLIVPTTTADAPR